VLTAPGNWPDEDVLGNAGTPQAWNDNVLEATCSALDFADSALVSPGSRQRIGRKPAASPRASRAR
jgi:hypothetical protein